MDNNTFSIEHQYKLYLKRMGFDEKRMHPVQRQETKRTFYGSWGQLLLLMRDDLTKLSDDQAMEEMHSMINQVGDFFLKESGSLS